MVWGGKHVKAGAAVVDEVIAVLPVNLFHDILSSVMLRQMYEPIFAVTSAGPPNEEWGEKACPTAVDQRFIECGLNESSPVRFVLFDLVD